MNPDELSNLRKILDADGKIGVDLPCARCGYSLRTRLPEEFCPECGAPVLDAVHADPLRLMGVERLGRMRLGLGVMLAGMVLVLFPTYGLTNGMGLQGMPAVMAARVVWLLVHSLLPVGGILFSLGFRDSRSPNLPNIAVGLGFLQIGLKVGAMLSWTTRRHIAGFAPALHSLDLVAGSIRALLVTIQMRSLFGKGGNPGFNVYDLLPWMVGIEVFAWIPSIYGMPFLSMCGVTSCLNYIVGFTLFYAYLKAFTKIGKAMRTSLGV